MLKRISIFLMGVLFAFLFIEFVPAANAAVPTPEVQLTASSSKISGTSWTNDGTVGGTATLSTVNTPAPSFSSSDTSVTLNAINGQGQYITQALGTVTAFTEATFEIYMNVPASQSYTMTNAGMVFGWTGSYYDIWMQNNNCIGFNTGTSEIYGFTLTNAMKGSYHYYTFVMSSAASDSTKQVAYVDGVKQTLGFCFGSYSTSANKTFNGTTPGYSLGRYGSNNSHYGTYSVRGFKLWLRELTESQILESYNSTIAPTSHTIALTSGLNSAVYRTKSTIRSSTDVDGKVTFFFNGKRIPGCINLQTVSKQVDCTWKPSAINYNYITAQLVAPGGSLTTSTFRIFVSKRANTR